MSTPDTASEERDHAKHVATAKKALHAQLLTAITSLDVAATALSDLRFGSAHCESFSNSDGDDGTENLAEAARNSRNALRALAPLLVQPSESTDRSTA